MSEIAEKISRATFERSYSASTFCWGFFILLEKNYSQKRLFCHKEEAWQSFTIYCGKKSDLTVPKEITAFKFSFVTQDTEKKRKNKLPNITKINVFQAMESGHGQGQQALARFLPDRHVCWLLFARVLNDFLIKQEYLL